ncbi:MAG: hypothetical protein AAF799_12205 [Myxococcota bacterium]
MSDSRRILGLCLGLLGVLWFWAAPGLVSSNDGSHLALSRALLRGETALGEDVALTLWVDRSRLSGVDYSDRPPGTALLAAPAVALGSALDPALFEASREAKEVMVQPAAPRYVQTYMARVQRMRRRAPPLVTLQGTALMLAVHCAAMGVFGVMGVVLLLRRRELSVPAQVFAGMTLGVGCLWGPYSIVLFSHVSAGALAVWAVLGLEAGIGRIAEDGSWPAVHRWPLLGAGLAAGWASSVDYLVGLLVLGVGLCAVPPKRWLAAAPWVVLGALPILAATFAYHDAAFGSPLSIGYDHHANFEFARERSSTFSGNALGGAWSLWGLGQGAGVLALAPVMLVGVLGLAAHAERRWLLGALPWIVLLAMHRTPTGGAGEDHRYLVPLMPLLAVGLGLAWQRWAQGSKSARWVAAALVVLALVSAWLSWSHTLPTWG